MSDLREEHSTVNDAIENVRAGNVKLKYNETAAFVNQDTIEPSSYLNPAITNTTVPRGAMAVEMPIPTITTDGQYDNPDYANYWHKIEFADGSYLAYYFGVTWSEGEIQLLTHVGGTLRFYQYDPETEEYTMYSSGFWGSPVPGGAYNYWQFGPEVPGGSPHWYYTPVLYTPSDKFIMYIYLDMGMTYKLGYALTPLKINNLDIQAEFGTDSKNIPGIDFQIDGWEPFIDFLAGDYAGGIHYPGEASETGGGNGSFFNYNDDIDFPTIPSLQAIDLGFTSLYNPHEADVRAIARWLWSDDFTENIKMNYSDPLNNILGINFLAIPDNMIQNEISNFVVGNCDSGIQTLKVTPGNKNQYLELDCGERFVPEYWANFLDYNSSFQIWLPYIGFRQLRPDDILQAKEDSGTLQVKYIIDLLTGCAVCNIVSILKDRRTGNLVKHLLYSYNCNCFYSTPLSGANFMTMYNQQLNATASGISNLISSVGQMARGDISGAIGGITNLLLGQQQAKREYETAKPDYGRAGNSGGSSGYFSYKKPYIIKLNPIGQVPDNYEKMQGIPSMIYEKLSDLEGYTEVNAINLDSLNASSAEKSELMTIMKSGFYI